MLGLAMLVMGIVVLCRGRMPLSKKMEVRSPMARIVALILIAPFPIIFICAAAQVYFVDAEIIMVLACLIIATVIAFLCAEPKAVLSQNHEGVSDEMYLDD